jgi:hypothetical protein
LRGLFDGDGSCYAYFDSRWKSSFMFYIEFTSASSEFIHYIQMNNIQLFGVGAGSVRISQRAFCLAYAKKDSKILYKALYDHADSLYLARKYNKLKSFVEKDKSVIIKNNARVAKLVYALD